VTIRIEIMNSVEGWWYDDPDDRHSKKYDPKWKELLKDTVVAYIKRWGPPPKGTEFRFHSEADIHSVLDVRYSLWPQEELVVEFKDDYC